MKRSFFLGISIMSLFSCTDEKELETSIEPKNLQKVASGPVESSANAHVESSLGIPGNENYSLKIFKEHLNGDDKIDAIVTVNRLEHAMSKAAASNKTAKNAEMGFMGQYNYFFFFDGKSGQFSIPMLIASSALVELSVSFDNITSDAYKDVMFDYRVLDGSFKDFYTVNGMTPSRIFQWKNFVGLNTKESEAYYFKFDQGTMGPRKDILVMKAELIQPKEEIDIYKYDPEIKKSEDLLIRFFYHPSTGKYMTKNN
ncbi:MAG: hypothetical protein ACK47F_01810 [Flavobacteriales bacterium]